MLSEARAFMNAGNAWSTYWAPVINLAREPRWGRNIETPGEDPYLTGEYATAFVQGFQVSEDDPAHLQASACCKHYVANSMESSTEAGVSWTRHTFDAEIGMQDLVDSYLLPFQVHVCKYVQGRSFYTDGRTECKIARFCLLFCGGLVRAHTFCFLESLCVESLLLYLLISMSSSCPRTSLSSCPYFYSRVPTLNLI